LPHGGRLEQARRRWPDAPGPFLDLSTGINPHAYPLPPLPAECFTRLPEPESVTRLEQIAATAYGLRDPAGALAAPGTQALIQLLPRILGTGPVAVLGPTYNEHAESWRRAGAAVAAVTELCALTGAEVAVLCNPNNPDGRRQAPERLLELGAKALIVDEAFADLEPGPLSLVPLLPQPGVLVLRSFGKTYGLAGLRLGFALGEPAVVERLRALLGPWAVSGPAIAAGTAALADEAWRSQTRRHLEREGQRIDALLTQAGLTVLGGTLLFRLAATDQAKGLFDRLGQAGILVRSFVERPTQLRFGLPPDEAAWARLAAALR
jgi:cobalamin biosynthetic protein CobC